MKPLDAIDRRLIELLQAGLPATVEPWSAISDQAGLPVGDVLRRVQRMVDCGIIRRIAAVPNHYRLGLTANGMTVWDVDDAVVDELGPEVGALPFVSHCYRRPRRPPQWPYNLFAMVHGQDRDEVERKRGVIAERLGAAARTNAVLYSTRILKKTGFRLPG